MVAAEVGGEQAICGVTWVTFEVLEHAISMVFEGTEHTISGMTWVVSEGTENTISGVNRLVVDFGRAQAIFCVPWKAYDVRRAHAIFCMNWIAFDVGE